MVDIFANFKGSAPRMSTYLKSLGRTISCKSAKVLSRTAGPAGADLARKWVGRDIAKNPMELAGYQQQLRNQGWDTGKDRGMGQGMWSLSKILDLIQLQLWRICFINIIFPILASVLYVVFSHSVSSYDSKIASYHCQYMNSKELENLQWYQGRVGLLTSRA